MDLADLVDRAQGTAIVPHSRHWRRSTSIAATPSPTGSFVIRDRAQDATQQALLGAWRDLPTLREPERFEAWLHRLVVHACYVEARGERRRWNARFRIHADYHRHRPGSRLAPSWTGPSSRTPSRG